MQHIIDELEKKGWKIMSSDVSYIGRTFTVASVVAAKTIQQKDGSEKSIYQKGEGIARRSHLDSHDPALCQTIAIGRALKGLYIRLIERRPVTPLKGDHLFIG